MARGSMTLQTDTTEDLSDDEIEARQREADGEVKKDETVAEEPKAEAGETAVADGAAKTDEPVIEKVVGVASKDGSRVLPYSALQAERRASRQATSRANRVEQELAEARQLIEDLKAGKKPEDSNELTEADVARMEEDFPEQGKKLRATFNRAQEAVKAPKASEPEEELDDPLQEAIDQIPLLVKWQNEDAEKFARAQAIDASLETSPKWKGKPAVDRFSYVTKQVCDEFDIPLQEEPSAKTPGKDAKAVLETVKRATPNTLSDFKGGAAPDHGNVNYERMSPASIVGKFSQMTDDELDAHLAKLG